MLVSENVDMKPKKNTKNQSEVEIFSFIRSWAPNDQPAKK